ncbi:MAG TPA: alpha-L-rhamnosidase N-terminal domain-containing protein, partial [Lachnospiraceae bacterium]|nr:alpha-L-rhamnosidase N-terminal domain-containing protein [Lachnospiraceae bacterium]
MKSVRLRTEYLSNPQGIDIAVPRLSWNCTDGKIQSAYRIKAWDEEGSSVWDTGKVLSGQMVHILWNGRKLKSRDHISWKVRLWEEAEEPGEWSQEAFFEMGFLADHDWKASWITGNYMVNRYRRYPVDCFRKKFHIYKEVKKARLYATACGLYELCLNNTRVGDFVLAPGITDYNKRVQYQTYDVTALLLSQENEMTLMLADGW